MTAVIVEAVRLASGKGKPGGALAGDAAKASTQGKAWKHHACHSARAEGRHRMRIGGLQAVMAGSAAGMGRAMAGCRWT
jgi:hypothetical protein